MSLYQSPDNQIEVHHVPESERLVPMWDLKTVKTNSPAPAAATAPRQSRTAELMGKGGKYERNEPSGPDRDGPSMDVPEPGF